MSYQYTSGGQTYSYTPTAGSQQSYGYQQSSGYQQSGTAPTQGPNWNWWIPAEGISREVIQVDIQRYLGPEAVCKPGKNDGVSGYFISAYRNFTPAMIQDLKADSANWHRERRRDHGISQPGILVSKKSQPDLVVDRYENSQVHQSRQYWGPTDGRQGGQPAPQPSQSQPQQQQQSSYSSYPPGYRQQESRTHTTPSAPQSSGYQPPSYGYGQAQAGSPSTASAGSTYSGNNYSYGPSGQPQQQGSYPQQSETTPRQYAGQYPQGQYQHPQVPSSQVQVRPGYYLASDGNQYPYPTNPSTSQ